ncbi:hypothetical protein PVK06_028243 [Gossypium arboreum]|uniref:Uncharacterized protein n=1 Tax=Gossypium arboreum TaxID=29729 RepID=A0ABR0P469_GOSAR|nr:hypothetical protein PVK06_028243 [Gossypium arboreum]
MLLILVTCIGFARTMATQSELSGEDGIIVAADAIGNRVKDLGEAFLEGAENWISVRGVFYGSDSELSGTELRTWAKHFWKGQKTGYQNGGCFMGRIGAPCDGFPGHRNWISTRQILGGERQGK